MASPDPAPPVRALTPRLAVHLFHRQWRFEYRWARGHGYSVLGAMRWSTDRVERPRRHPALAQATD